MSQTRWTKTEAQRVIGQWQRSGLSLAAFAREQGWDEQRLRYWSTRVAQGTGRESSSSLTRFVPGVIVGASPSVRVNVMLPRGVSIEAGRIEDVSPAWVAEVVRALEGEP